MNLAAGTNVASARQQREEVLGKLGPVALKSDNVAVRLQPYQGNDEAWGEDLVKGASVEAVVNKDFSMSRFLVGGTDGSTSADALMGAGYTGVEKKKHRDTANFVLAAAHTEPGGAEVVAALPSRKDGGLVHGELNYARLRATNAKGHATPEQIREWAGRLAHKAAEGHAPAAPAVPAPAAVAEAIARAKEEEDRWYKEAAKDNLPVKVNQVVVQPETLTEEQKQTQAREDDFVFHQTQLMMLNFPPASAVLFASFRAWCTDPKHALSASEEAQRLQLLEGRWRILNDEEFPGAIGTVMVIKDSKIPSPFGEDQASVSFRAYRESRFAGIFPMKNPVTNATVDIYRMFKLNGTRLEWDGANLWERVADEAEPPAAAKPVAAVEAEPPAPAKPAAAKPADWMKALGEAIKGAKTAPESAAPGAEKKGPGAALADIFSKLGKQAAEQTPEQKKEAGAAIADALSKLGGLLKPKQG